MQGSLVSGLNLEKYLLKLIQKHLGLPLSYFEWMNLSNVLLLYNLQDTLCKLKITERYINHFAFHTFG